jgi:uncharacterized protein (TIGR02145 family)
MYEGMTGWRPGEGSTVTWWGRSMKSLTKVTTTATNGVSNTDGTGFNALLVGFLVGGSFDAYGTNSNFWSGSTNSTTIAWRRAVSSSYSGVARLTDNKYYSFSVRCKKNDI